MSKRIKTKWQASLARERALMRRGYRYPSPPSAEMQSILISFGVPVEDVYGFYMGADIGSESWYTPADVIITKYKNWKEQQNG